MLYLAIQDTLQTLYIPRASGEEKSLNGLVLRLCRGGVEKVFSDLKDLNVNSLYYIIDITGAGSLSTGEYDYVLENANGDVYSSGILTAGNYVRNIKDVPGGAQIIEYGN